jgi:hypothetical protein
MDEEDEAVTQQELRDSFECDVTRMWENAAKEYTPWRDVYQRLTGIHIFLIPLVPTDFNEDLELVTQIAWERRNDTV